MARKSKLTEDVLDTILTKHSNGLPINSCCDLVGVSRAAFYQWMEKGEQGSEANNGLYVKLYEGMQKARAQCIESIVEKAFDNNSPQMLMYLLKVYDPDTFNIAEKTENTNVNIHTFEDLFDDDTINEIAND